MSEFSGRVLLLYLALLAFAVAFIAFGWVGFSGSDDGTYFAASMGWLNEFPYVGQSHWALRHTLVIPSALAFMAFGIDEVTLVLPIVLYHLALLTLIFIMVGRYFGWMAGSFAFILFASLPLAATQSSIVVPDFAETFFCLLSLTLFFEATQSDRPIPFLVLAGLAAGMSWLTRETVVFFLLTYGILFLVGYGIPRRLYFVMGAAFVSLICIEALYFAIVAGDPFHRVVTDLSTHLGVDAEDGLSAAGERFSSLASRTEGAVNGVLARTGSLSVNRFLDPILVILANQEFMFFYYLALPVGIWMGATAGRQTEPRKRFIRVFGLAGLVWFICLWLQIGMTLLPRYYMIPSAVLAMLVGIWLATVVVKRSALLVGVILLGIVITNMMGIYIDNRNPVYGERSVILFLEQNPDADVVVTDPETARRGRFLYIADGVEDRVAGAVPQPGDVYIYNPRYTTLGLQQGGTPAARQARLDELSVYRPSPEWQEIWRADPGRRWIGVLIEWLGLKPMVPAEIYRRLDQPNLPVVAYRIPAEAGADAAGQ